MADIEGYSMNSHTNLLAHSLGGEEGEGDIVLAHHEIIDSSEDSGSDVEEEEMASSYHDPTNNMAEDLNKEGHKEDDIEMSLRVIGPSNLREEGEERGNDHGGGDVRRISLVADSTTTTSSLPTHATIYKQGHLLRQTKTLGRWVKRYCSIEDHKMFLTKNKEDKLREEVLLKDATLVENSTQNVNNSFTIMTPHSNVVIAATSRKEMEEWLTSIKLSVQKANNSDFLDISNHLDGQHSWFSCSHPRPVYCNVCGEVLNGVGWRGLSCEVCKFKCHRHCALKVSQSCKWATCSNLEKDGADILPDLSFPHQWIEGNLPSGSKCIICKKACGSLKRLQDFRCLWCKWTVHTDCKRSVQPMCTLGSHHLSTLPPSAVHRSSQIVPGMWEPFKLPSHDPVLALVNSKSGDNKGVRFLRRLKYWLNPLQVFDLAISGPDSGLKLFQRLDKFRVIVFGGDGSVGWVLQAIDKLHLHSKCTVGVVPLGTGNDLARVLGWGAQCGDEERIPTLLSEMECSTYRLLDRWSVWFTTDTNIDANSFVKSFHRSRSVGSNDSKQLLCASPDDSMKSLVTHVAETTPTDSTHLTRPINIPPMTTPSEYSSEHEIDSPSHIVYVTPPDDMPIQRPHPLCQVTHPPNNQESLQSSLMSHLSTVLLSVNETEVISSAQALCELVRQFLNSLQDEQKMKLSEDEFTNDPLMQKCSVLDDKLKKLIHTLTKNTEPPPVTTPTTTPTTTPITPSSQNNTTSQQQQQEDTQQKPKKTFQCRDTLMARANSLKKAVENVIDMTEKVVDDQQKAINEETDLTPPPSRNNQPSPSPSGRTTDESEPFFLPSSDMKEVYCMNNYFGIGLDAKIAYEFHIKRFKNRTRNKILYGYLGGREFFTNTQRYLERKISLECDSKEIQLPQRLQGLVFLNIPSYMAGTNFWGTEREKDGFSAPSIDDKLLEVVGVTGFTHLATTKVLGIQNQRLAQCRSAKVTLHSEMMLQVDGEAWAQEPGTIIINHKNRAKLIVKDKAFVQSLESWSLKHVQTTSALSPAPPTSLLCDVLTLEEIKKYQEINNTVRPLIDCLQLECETNAELHFEITPHIATIIQCLDRVFATPDTISETADVEHLQDLDRSVKALIQETLWFLNMERVSLEHEDEIRQLLTVVETQVKRVIVPLHSLSERGYRRASDSLLVHRTQRHNVGRHSPNLSSHRERAVPVSHTDMITTSHNIIKSIGKDIQEWTVDDVCEWLKGVGFSQYSDTIKSSNYTGQQLLDMKTSDMQALGIDKVGSQTQLRQALQTLKFPPNYGERRLTN